jgi:hypothetical protein
MIENISLVLSGFALVCFLASPLVGRLGAANARKNGHRYAREQHQLWLDAKRMPMREDAKVAFGRSM